MPIKSKMMSDAPPALLEVADERDALVDEQVDAIIPPAEQPFNVKVLDALADVIGALSGLMGIEVEVERYTEPTTTLDPDVARFLFMLDKAAADYGKPLPIKLDAIKGDNELTTITAHLKRLAADAAFKDFLMGEDDEEDDVDVEVEVKRAGGDRAMRESDELFMGRMR
jgi:hypothetical protein